MKIFRDVDGDPYEIVLNVRTLTEIEAITGINLGLPDHGEPMLWLRLTSDPILVSRLIWLSCRNCPTVKENKRILTEDLFYEDILVDLHFEEAHKQFLAEYRDFFQQRSIGGTGPRVSKAVSTFLDLLNSGAMSTSSPGQSESIPQASPSASSPG